MTVVTEAAALVASGSVRVEGTSALAEVDVEEMHKSS